MQSWLNARDRGLALVIWLALLLLLFWGLAHLVTTLLLLILAAVLAYALTPAVTLLSRWMPRRLSVVFVYILALSALGALGYVVFSTAVSQITTLAQNLPDLVKPSTPDQPSGIAHLLQPLGVTDEQVNQARQQVITWAESSAGQIASQTLPILTSAAAAVVDLILVIVLSIYLVIDGPRVIAWLRLAAPIKQRSQSLFVLDTLARTVGGYIRGELFLAVLMGGLVGGGMALFGLPYAVLLGVLAALFEFLPILGTLASGATCVLLALATRGGGLHYSCWGTFSWSTFWRGTSSAHASSGEHWGCTRWWRSWPWWQAPNSLASGAPSLPRRWLACSWRCCWSSGKRGTARSQKLFCRQRPRRR